MSVISNGTFWQGTILNEDEIVIEGRLEGKVEETKRVVIAVGAHVRGTVEAQVVSLAGEVVGAVTCRDKLELMSTGRIKGEATTRALTVQEGAFIDAALEMIKPTD